MINYLVHNTNQLRRTFVEKRNATFISEEEYVIAENIKPESKLLYVQQREVAR